MPEDDMFDDDGIFRLDADLAFGPPTDALSLVSRRLLGDSEGLRKRSAELRDEMMRKLSV